MKITYMENPLATTVELNDEEKISLFNKILEEQIEENEYLAQYYLDKGDNSESEKYVKRSKDIEVLTKYSKKLHETFIEELMSQHFGDCTCIACSCMKCYAESILDINTIKGLSKYMGHNVAYYFKKFKTIDEVIKNCDNYVVTMTEDEKKSWNKIGGYEQHIERWTKNAKDTANWLRNYKKEFLNK